jgi:MFS family permease
VLGLTPARQALAAAVGVNLAGVLPLFLTGAMSVQIGRDLNLNAQGIGWILACFAGMSLAFSAPVGSRVGRFGITRSLRLAAVISGIALVGCALAPGVAVLAGAVAVAGFANAFGQTASNALVAARVREGRFGLAYAIKQSAIPLSILLGGLAVPGIALPLSWRAAYALAGLIAVSAMILVPAGVEPSPGRAENPVPSRMRTPVWLLSAGLVAAVVAATSIGAHAASSAVAIGFSESAAGLMVAVGGAAGLCVRLAAGVRADRVSSSALVTAAVLCVGGGVGWLLMSSLLPLLFVVGLLMANAFGWGWPGLIHLAVARRFPDSTAAASGVTQTGVALGLLLGPPLIGTIAVSSGWTAAWITSAVAALTGAGVILLARRLLVRDRQAALTQSP